MPHVDRSAASRQICDCAMAQICWSMHCSTPTGTCRQTDLCAVGIQDPAACTSHTSWFFLCFAPVFIMYTCSRRCLPNNTLQFEELTARDALSSRQLLACEACWLLYCCRSPGMAKDRSEALCPVLLCLHAGHHCFLFCHMALRTAKPSMVMDVRSKAATNTKASAAQALWLSRCQLPACS